MKTQNVDYGVAVQQLYLELFLSDPETYVRCQSIYDPTLFSRKLQPAAEFIKLYVDEYNVLPTHEILEATTHTHLAKHDNIRPEHLDWLLDDFETFIRHKGLERAIIESSDLLESGDYGSVEAKIKEAVQIGLQKDLGTDYFANPTVRLNNIKSNNGQIPTTWTAIDKVLYGGVNRGELNIWAAGSGMGKSIFLANLAVNWVLAGLNVMYVTLELSEDLVCMRMDSMITGVNSREVFKNIDDVNLKVKAIKHSAGKLQVKYLPSGKTVNDLRAYLKEYEVKSGTKIDVMLVDYLDLLMPISRKISAENLFIKDKYISEELRNFATEKRIVVVTAAQLNRSGVDEVDFNHSHISGGLSKIQTADNVFGIFTSNAMRERGQYQVQLLKTRNSSGVGSKVDLAFNVDTLRITDFTDDTASAIINNARTTTPNTQSAFLESIKNRSTTSNQPKVEASVESAKLRALLNSNI